MQRILVMLVAIVIGFCSLSEDIRAQFKEKASEKPSVSESLLRRPSPLYFLSWFNPNNFMMRHQFSMSYTSFAGRGLSLASYTNSMFYRIADPLHVRLDVSMLYSPYSSFGTDDLNRIYISNAELNYRPWENFYIQLQYRQLPIGTYSPYYNPFYRRYR